MSTVILTTVGTSLLLNARRDNRVQDSEILAYIKQDPIKASAETNSLKRILHKGDEIVLLHSDTEEGARAAEFLEMYWQQQGVACSRVRIPGLAYEAQGFVDYGLKNFVRALASQIRKAFKAQKEVIINATGGFKAEISYATVLGLVFKVPVCYIHEQFKEIATLPSTPISWDYGLFVLHGEFFDWLGQGEGRVRPKSEVMSRMAALPEEALLLLEEFELDGQPYIGLSPLGEAYYEAFQGELEQVQSVPIYFSAQAQKTWQSLEPSNREKFRRVLRNLRLPNRASQSERKSGGGDALVYPMGHVDERVFYAERDGKLYVFALTRHGPEYDRMCQKGFSWSDHMPENFVPWEG